MSEKLCVFCEHFVFENDICGEYAEGASAHCSKQHFLSYSSIVFDEGDLRKIIIRAEKCNDYSQVKL